MGRWRVHRFWTTKEWCAHEEVDGTIVDQQTFGNWWQAMAYAVRHILARATA